MGTCNDTYGLSEALHVARPGLGIELMLCIVDPIRDSSSCASCEDAPSAAMSVMSLMDGLRKAVLCDHGRVGSLLPAAMLCSHPQPTHVDAVNRRVARHAADAIPKRFMNPV